MRHVKIFGLALVALSAVSAMMASSASAVATQLHYLVGGHGLASGETRLILAKIAAGTEFVLKGETFGVEAVTKCKKLKLNPNNDPRIVGGLPGTSEKNLIEFEECKGTIGGAACKEVKVHNVLTRSELVMILKPAAKAGLTGALFKPESGTTFTTILDKECGIFGNTNAEVTGTTVALASPENTDQLFGKLIWKAGAEEITEVEKRGGEKAKDGLLFAGNTASLEGTAEVWLENDELWGIL